MNNIKSKLLLFVHDVEKWDDDEDGEERHYVGTWRMVDTTTEEGREIEQSFIDNGVGADPCHEYLIVNDMVAGEAITMRNSYVDLFQLHLAR